MMAELRATISYVQGKIGHRYRLSFLKPSARRRWFWCLMLLALTACGTPTLKPKIEQNSIQTTFTGDPRNAEKRVALVIGNANYESSIRSLQNTINDARAISDKLEQLNFDVIEKANLDLDGVQQALREFETKLIDADVALFFYSGHGIQYEGKNYIIPTDVVVGPGEVPVADIVALDEVLNFINSSPAKTKLIFLDACRDELIPGDKALGNTWATDIGTGLTNFKELEGSIIATSAAPGKTAIDAQEGSLNSPYSAALLQHLDDPCINVSQMMDRVSRQVTRATGQKQTPSYSYSLRRPFIFNIDPERCCPNCGLLMVELPAGSFLMGAPASEEGSDDDERPRHEVHVEAFAIGKYEVTFAEWDECFDDGGCDHWPADHGWGRGRRPVIDVSWNDAKQFVEWLSERDEEEYRLPTEAEWEFAARALPLPEGSNPPRYPWGDDIYPQQANYDKNVGETTEVDLYRPNNFDLHDMTGNVWEWVEDRWHGSHEGAPVDGSARNDGTNPHRVIRGGSWRTPAEELRSASRYYAPRNSRSDQIGFRIVRPQVGKHVK